MIQYKKVVYILTIIFFFSCCQSKDGNNNKEAVVESFDSLQYYLKDYLLSELGCSEIAFISTKQFYDSIYVSDFLKATSSILIDNIKDSTLVNQKYEVYDVPEDWIDKNNLDEQCSVYITKIWKSTDGKVQFTYVVMDNKGVLSKYKILLIRDKNDSKWRIGAIG